ncbi:MAG: hypothetical protein D6696_03550 [Acidobacteria bacterium]|nr:MAG: hypothetical protein D6696_03550 [Acidobacteriota bacterium]
MSHVCSYCDRPIIFRGNPPQVYHVGSGWPCWKARQQADEPPPEPVALNPPDVTGGDELKPAA